MNHRRQQQDELDHREKNLIFLSKDLTLFLLKVLEEGRADREPEGMPYGIAATVLADPDLGNKYLDLYFGSKKSNLPNE